MIRCERRGPVLGAIISAALLAAACGGDPAPDPGVDADPAAGPDQASDAEGAPGLPPGTDIWIASLGSDAEGLPTIGDPANVTARPGYDNQPFFLPDGSAFLYTSADAEGRTDIWRYDLASGTAGPLTRTDPESEYSATPIAGGGFAVVRVEADSTQRLWRFSADGSNPSLLLDDVAPVGYHAWLDETTVALFVLGSPASLHVAEPAGPFRAHVFDGIGPSLQRIPGRRAVSFVEVVGPGETWIRAYDGDSGEAVRIAPGLDGGAHHAWTPDGVLLMASGRRLFAHRPGIDGEGEDARWVGLGEVGPSGIRWSRIAVSPGGDRIALVGEWEAPPDG